MHDTLNQFIKNMNKFEESMKKLNKTENTTLSKDNGGDSMEINILGNKWTIKKLSGDEDDRIIDQLGFSDKSTREIGIMQLEDRDIGEIKDRERMLRHTLRHEIIHSLIAECGIDQYIDWAGNEEVVDFFAYHYPTLKKIFKELKIEE